MAKKKPKLRYCIVSYLGLAGSGENSPKIVRFISVSRIKNVNKLTKSKRFTGQIHGSIHGYTRKSKAIRIMKEQLIQAHLEGRAYIESE